MADTPAPDAGDEAFGDELVGVAPPPVPFGQTEFRAALGHFASGVVVVTGATPDGPAGFTCQSFFSLSLDPPLIAIGPGKSSTSWPPIAASGAFCANILAADQETLCMTFAKSGLDKFAGVAYEPTQTGSPRLGGALAWIDCRVEAVHDTGDHHLVVGAVVDLGVSQGDPLLFFQGKFGSFAALSGS